jgi:hypothetical protein
MNCGQHGKPKSKAKGSFVIEMFLWSLVLLSILIPIFLLGSVPVAMLYSLWRMTSRSKVCPSCAAPNMVFITSPAAQKILAS